MKRGEIWAVTGGVYSSKPRPALVLQDDRFEGTDSVTVCPLTSMAVRAPLLRLEILADEISGLSATSFAMIDKLTTVRRSNVTHRIGRLSARQIVEVERLILVFLGLTD